jgi:hypothetical protein
MHHSAKHEQVLGYRHLSTFGSRAQGDCWRFVANDIPLFTGKSFQHPSCGVAREEPSRCIGALHLLESESRQPGVGNPAMLDEYFENVSHSFGRDQPL